MFNFPNHLVNNIMKVQNGTKFIEAIQDIECLSDYNVFVNKMENNKMDSCTSYVDMQELGCYKGEELSSYFELNNLGSGCYRCALNIDKGFCIKVALNSEGLRSNRKELTLYNYVKNKFPELLGMLLPVIGHGKNFNIYPMITPADLSEYKIAAYHARQVIKMFGQYGIDIMDLEGRPDNFGIYNGKIVILDYGDWINIDVNRINVNCCTYKRFGAVKANVIVA